MENLMNFEWFLSNGNILLQIIGINLLLSGDNALVIAIATRGLPKEQHRIGIIVGVLGAVVMRIVLCLGVWRLLEIPGLHLLGGIALLWLGWNMTEPQTEGHSHSHSPNTLMRAVRQVILADAIMSADNILAVAGAARGDLTLMLTGIALSFPFVALGSDLLGRLLERWPILIAGGAGLLGWVAGELFDSDTLLDQYAVPILIQSSMAPVLGAALLAIALGRIFFMHRAKKNQ
jgi:YjbE family integral membrane protein